MKKPKAKPTAHPKMVEIERLCLSLSQKRTEMHAHLIAMEAEKASIAEKYRPKLSLLAGGAAGIKALLATAVTAAKELFEKKKSQEFHGIKVGFRKGSGKIDWDDDDKVVARIKKHLPEQASLLIIKKEVPNADTVRQLSATDMAKIGVELESTGDEVFIRLSDPSIDKATKELIDNHSTKEAA